MASSAAICGPQLDLFNKSHIKNYRFELFRRAFKLMCCLEHQFSLAHFLRISFYGGEWGC
jgi:hypothetical protein